MEYRILGRTGVKVSRLCMGTMSFGDKADEKVSAAMFHRCREVGVNFFDTANRYAGGRSEEILGNLIGGCREEIILTSKVGNPAGSDVNARGLSRRHIMKEIEGSLRRLRTDRLDLYFLHSFDPQTPAEEPLQALDDLVHQGKILYPAVSNWAAWQIATGLGISAANGWARIQCIQPMYNLVKRQAEVEIFPLADAERLGVITYSPLGGGLLTGRYGAKSRPEEGRLIKNSQYQRRYGDPMYFAIAERFTRHAEERGMAPSPLALAWVMAHPAITAPIIGPWNMNQLEAYLTALAIRMTPEWRKEISALSVEPPPATDRREEQTQEA